MQAHIRRQMDERTEIVSSLSHDLQTPITRLRLRADLIADEELRHRFAADLDGVSHMIKEGRTTRAAPRCARAVCRST